MEPTDSPQGKNSSRAWVYVIVVIVILLVLWWLLSLDNDGRNREEVVEIAPGETLRRAGEGNVITGFPEDLILERGVVADESYSITYEDQNLEQPVVSFISQWSLDRNFEEYDEYLLENEWEIINQESAEEGDAAFLYARKGPQDVNITFQDLGEGGVRVVIAVADRGVDAGPEPEDTPVPDDIEEQ